MCIPFEIQEERIKKMEGKMTVPRISFAVTAEFHKKIMDKAQDEGRTVTDIGVEMFSEWINGEWFPAAKQNEGLERLEKQ